MEEITNEILRVFEDLQRMRSGQEQNGVGKSDKDSYGYAFEPFDAFSTSPLEFTETALRLDIEAREMFAMLRTVNRHSPLFYKLSGQFEKMVSLLGSCCITKAVLEKQENEAFELLQDLTIDSLREMAAFNFRKCSAAFMDSRSCGKTNLGAFALSLRWAAVDKRLIATEAKIRNQKSEIRNDASGQGSVVSDQNELPVAGCQLPEEGESEQLPVSAFAEKGRAFPAMPVPGKIRNQISEIRNGAGDQWPVVIDQNELPVVGEIRNEFSGQGSVVSDQLSAAGCQLPEEGDNGDGSLRHQTVSPGKFACPDMCGMRPRPLYSGQELRPHSHQVVSPELRPDSHREVFEEAEDGLEALWRELLLRDMRNGSPFLQKAGRLWEESPPREAWPEEVLLPDLAAGN